MKYTHFLQATDVNEDLCLTIAMEECSELIQAISKAKRGKLDIDNLVEEIADVKLCINWLEKIFNINCDIENELFDYKADRVLRCLNLGVFK